jgi:hypothetical protein
MIQFGSKRTYGKCTTSRNGNRTKVHVKARVKNRKYGRQYDVEAELNV